MYAGRCVHGPSPQVQQTGYGLEIVLYAMMQLADNDLLLREGTREMRFAVRKVRPRLGHLDSNLEGRAQARKLARRLDDIVVEAFLHQFDGDRLVARAREHDDGTGRVFTLDGQKHLASVRPTQVQIGQDEVRWPGRNGRLELVCIRYLEHLRIGEQRIDLAQLQLAIIRIVVDDQNAHGRLFFGHEETD